MKRSDSADRETTFNAATQFLREQYGVECLGKLGFENAYALAMSRQRADELGIRSIDDLARYAPRFSIAGDLGFFSRNEWKAVYQLYGLEFQHFCPMDSSLMYTGIANNVVDVVCAHSTDDRVLQNDLVLLEDPKHAFPPYDAMLLLSARAARDGRLREVLQPLVNSIDGTIMRKANHRVDMEGESPSRAAADLLQEASRKQKH